MPDLIIAFDASTPSCPVIVGRLAAGTAELLVSDAQTDGSNQASGTLLDRVDAALREAGATPGDVTHVACGRGPGTFTGTRVAIASAMGLALGRGAPLLTVSTLAVVAASAGESGRIRACLDARRGEIYAATFEVDPDAGAVTALDQEMCVSPASAYSSAADLFVGSGVDVHPPPASAHARSGVTVTPEGLWPAVRSGLAAGRAADPAEARAVYLRKSYAELGLNTPKRKTHRSPFLEG